MKYQVIFTREAAEDLERLFDHLLDRELRSAAGDPDIPVRAIEAIQQACQFLTHSPFSCRKAGQSAFGVIGVGFQLNPIDTCAAPSRSGRHAAAPAPQKLRRLPDHQPCRGKVLHVARDDAVQARVPGGFVQHGVFVVGKAGVQRVGQR